MYELCRLVHHCHFHSYIVTIAGLISYIIVSFALLSNSSQTGTVESIISDFVPTALFTGFTFLGSKYFSAITLTQPISTSVNQQHSPHNINSTANETGTPEEKEPMLQKEKNMWLSS